MSISVAFISAPVHLARSSFSNRRFVLQHHPPCPLHHHIPATRPCTTTTTKLPVRCSSSNIPNKNDDDNDNKNNSSDDENVPAAENSASSRLDQDWRAFRARLVRDEVDNPSMSPILNFLSDDNVTSSSTSSPPLEELATTNSSNSTSSTSTSSNNESNKNIKGGGGPDPHTSSPSSSIKQQQQQQHKQKMSSTTIADTSAPAAESEKSQLWAHPVSFIETGSLLISSPRHFSGSHACTFFAKTAILILHHSEDEGTIGVIINRPLSPHMKRISETSKPSSTTTTTNTTTSKTSTKTTQSSQSKSKLQTQSQSKPPPSSQQQQQQPNKHSTPFDFNTASHTPSSSSSSSCQPTKTTDDIYSIDDLFACADPPVFLGGPVGLETLGVLHGDPTFGHVVTGAVRSAPFTQAFKRFQAGALPHARFFLGYSGWRKGQLQDEIDNGIWLLCSACDDIVLRTWKTGTQLHKTVLPLMGEVYAQIANELDTDSVSDDKTTNNSNNPTTHQQQQSPTIESDDDDDDDDDDVDSVKDR